jgi:hypothetical protein
MEEYIVIPKENNFQSLLLHLEKLSLIGGEIKTVHDKQKVIPMPCHAYCSIE